ncbi:DUF917 domain-containing protein [Anaerotignum lactatifermentans]|uniref:DUF917 domain-containing protein n=1 Tax=Anaerotignum lactatifermentans TaxID=160404 RepID=UPI0024B20D17|nr:DUF917 domain-containing protein [Anaerotignum lactatifermentans]
MATKKLTNIQEATDFVRGCTFYATGGGGLPENGIESLMSEINEKGFVQITDISEIPDDAVAVCPFLMGSIAPHDEATLKEMAGFGFIDGVNKEKARLAKAIQELEAYTGVKTTVVVPIELAGANTSGPISAGSSLGMMAVDGDYCGRAIPEILQITPYLYDRKWLPVASVDEWDNVCIIKKATNLRVVERIGKLISAGAYGLAGQAGFIMSGKELKETVIAGTLSKSYELGKFIREAQEAHLDHIPQKIAEKVGGWVLAEGKRTDFEDEDRIGYYWGTTTIQSDAGDEYKIWFKNENHVCWKNGEPFVSSPDLICVVDRHTGEPIPNPKMRQAQEVAIIVLPCDERLRQEKIKKVLDPQYFGFEDISYVPVEERMK